MNSLKSKNSGDVDNAINKETSPGKEKQKINSGMSLLAEVSTLAWNLVIPIVGGVMLGHYIDDRTNGELTWTLSLLVLGILIAFSNLYNLYIEQGRNKLEPKIGKSEGKEVNENKK